MLQHYVNSLYVGHLANNKTALFTFRKIVYILKFTINARQRAHGTSVNLTRPAPASLICFDLLCLYVGEKLPTCKMLRHAHFKGYLQANLSEISRDI